MNIPKNRGLRWVAPTALSLALVAGACGGDDDEASADDEPAATVDAADESGDSGAGAEAVALELEAHDFEFAPNTLSAPAGAEVTLTLNNTGEAPHTFTAEAVGVDEEVEAGESTEVTFTMPETGSLEFVCTFHEAQGMVGTVESS